MKFLLKNIFLLIGILFLSFGGISFALEKNETPSKAEQQAGSSSSSTSSTCTSNCGNSSSSSSSSSNESKCDGVELNTNVPFVGKCIPKDNAGSAFPSLMSGLMKIVITLILLTGFLMIIVGGVMITASGASQGLHGKGKELIMRVVYGIIILGMSGIILHTINPNFFK